MDAQTKADLFGWTEEYQPEPTQILKDVIDSCPDAVVVRESQQWSRIAAVDQWGCVIHNPVDFQGGLPFDPFAVAVQITWVVRDDRPDLAWVATWPVDD